LLKTPTFILTILKAAIFEILSVAKALKVVENLPLLGYKWEFLRVQIIGLLISYARACVFL
jgi:hypothetical protein